MAFRPRLLAGLALSLSVVAFFIRLAAEKCPDCLHNRDFADDPQCLLWVTSGHSGRYHANGCFRAYWFDPGLMDRLKLVLVTLLKSHRTDVTKIAVPALSIIKTFNVIEHIGLRFISS